MTAGSGLAHTLSDAHNRGKDRRDGIPWGCLHRMGHATLGHGGEDSGIAHYCVFGNPDMAGRWGCRSCGLRGSAISLGSAPTGQSPEFPGQLPP